MADNNFRSYSRDNRARVEAPRDNASDPLAELARLIGQGDPYAEHGSRQSRDDAAAAPGFDWAANQDYAEAHVEEHYGPPPVPPASYAAYARDEQDYEAEAPAGGQYFAGPAAKFNGFGEDGERLGPVLPPRQFPAFMSPAPAERYETEAPDRAQEAGEDYGDYADDYYEEPPRPRQRGGLVVMMAVLGLVIVGTAGAFAYRAMFGTVAFPSLPPIIKASMAPNKIMPSNSAAQADNTASSNASGQAGTDKLVSREEQPVSMEPPKIGSRVVATIPISGGQMSPMASAAPPPAPVDTSSPPSSTASAAPAPDAAAAAPPPMTATAAPAAAPASSETKRVHTVVIHADQPGTTVPAPRSARATSANKAGTSAAPAPAGANAPLSIMPGAEGEAVKPAPIASAPSRSRAAAAAPVALASAEPAAAAPVSVATSEGRYAVQVTSQRSEADAKASFRELQAKFPNQLSGHEPIIRRADLGAKGVYYRALVGPYASAEQAAGACSSIKAAGGNCLVQKN